MRSARGRARAALLAGALLASVCLGADVAGADGAAEGWTPPGSITFVAENLFATANGTFHRWRVTRLEIDAAAPERGEVEVEIDIASIDTGIEERDEHLRSGDFFDVETFPRATVRVHAARPDGRGEGGPRYAALFEVRIRDVEKSLPGHFEVLSQDPPRVRGALTLDRMDFGIGDPHSRWNPFSIRQPIPVAFEAELPAIR